MGLTESLSGVNGELDFSWRALQAGLSGLVFLGLTGGVVTLLRRRRDLFSGFGVGGAFALFLGATGILMIAELLAPPGTRAWVRGGQILMAPLALVLMAGFLQRLRGLETSEDCQAREAELAAELRQARSKLHELKEQNAELTRLKDQAVSDNQRLASERQSALQQAEAMRTREEDSGLYTWDHFVERLREEFERSSREGNMPLPLFIGFPGLDSQAGADREALMGRAGHIIRQGLRLPDLACRFGEREILVIPYGADIQAVAALARRLHRSLQRDLTGSSDSGPTAPSCVFVVLEFEICPVRFEDYLEACECSAVDIANQPPDRLTRLPARFTTET